MNRAEALALMKRCLLLCVIEISTSHFVHQRTSYKGILLQQNLKKYKANFSQLRHKPREDDIYILHIVIQDTGVETMIYYCIPYGTSLQFQYAVSIGYASAYSGSIICSRLALSSPGLQSN